MVCVVACRPSGICSLLIRPSACRLPACLPACLLRLAAYFPLATPDHPTPGVAALAERWRYYLGRVRAWQEADPLLARMPLVFTEVGYPSFTETAVTPWVTARDW